jgi:hypothetical protein
VTDAPGTDELQVIDPWAPEPVWCGYCVRAHKRKEIDFLTERFLRISEHTGKQDRRIDAGDVSAYALVHEGEYGLYIRPAEQQITDPEWRNLDTEEQLQVGDEYNHAAAAHEVGPYRPFNPGGTPHFAKDYGTSRRLLAIPE